MVNSPDKEQRIYHCHKFKRKQWIEKSVIIVHRSCALTYWNSSLLRYVYKLEARTGGGSSTSDDYIVQTPLWTPEEIHPPYNITVVGPYSIFAAWTPPGKGTKSLFLSLPPFLLPSFFLVWKKFNWIQSWKCEFSKWERYHLSLGQVNKIIQTTLLSV